MSLSLSKMLGCGGPNEFTIITQERHQKEKFQIEFSQSSH